MKKTILLITILVSLSIILFMVFTKANNSNISKEEVLNIGEEKYLEFLWMVDGAFNNERMNEEFSVNGKKLSEEKKEFTCVYKTKKDKTCIGNNFEESFDKLFSYNITYGDVYGNDTLYNKWYKYENGKYLFTNSENCNWVRMDVNQELSIVKIENDKLTFEVTYKKNSSGAKRNRLFVLVNEKDTWKVSEAYYADLCEMDYNIG